MNLYVEPMEPPDFDANAKRTEWLVLILIAAIPCLIALSNYVFADPGDFAWRFNELSAALRRIFNFAWFFFQTVVLQGLSIWLVFRQPFLGGRVARSLVISLIVVSAIGVAKLGMYEGLGLDAAGYLQVLIYDLGSFVIGIAGMTLARRVAGIVLVRSREPQTPVARPVSILELLLWTSVVAGCLVFYQQLMNLSRVQMTPDSFPRWFYPFSIFFHHVPNLLLVVSVIYCWQFTKWRFWKWFSAVTVVYTFLMVLGTKITNTAVKTAWSNSVATSWMELLPSQLMPSLFAALGMVIVVYVLLRCGYRFQRTVRSEPQT